MWDTWKIRDTDRTLGYGEAPVSPQRIPRITVQKRPRLAPGRFSGLSRLSHLSLPLRAAAALALTAGGCAAAGDDPVAASAPASVESAEPPVDLSGPRCAAEITEVAAYQSVKVSLGSGDAVTSARSAELIAGKPALLRVFLTPSGAPTAPIDVKARVVVTTADQQASHDATTTLTAASNEEALTSTLDVMLPAAELTPEARVTVELLAPECAGLPRTRFPRSAELELRPRAVGPLRVTLVPFRYDTDGSGRLPDTSPQQLEAYRAALLAMYPVPAVELTVHAPVPTTLAVSAQDGWGPLLDQVRQTRAADRPTDDVYYFGLVAPAETQGKYCGTGCVTGVSFVGGVNSPQTRASVGIGYPGPLASEVLLHELGHAHGRAHAPCGKPKDPDAAFPYPEALIGVWGYDSRGAQPLRPPTLTRDIMSYCGPRWVSDYTFRALTARSVAVNRTEAAGAGQALTVATPTTTFRTLHVGAAGARWGAPITLGDDAAGDATPAQALDPANQSLGALDLRALPLADTDERFYLLPATTALPEATATLSIAGGPAIPLPPPPAP
jgi:hypothetical protein